jgi:hypothetical protein
MEKAKIDVAVLLLFFARPEHTAKVFEQIKIARPSKLFLYQDGPREGRADDITGIHECRKIVEDIDWECEVHRMYQEKNYGCDPSEYISQKWMFSYVNKGIILEDDDVPSQSFFPFCKELLDKYENDTRISMICGQNHMETVDIDVDYFFCRKHGPIWGWATWKRFVDLWDSQYHFLEDQRSIDNLMKMGDLWDTRLRTYYKHKETGREHYEDFVSSTRIFNSMLAIIPSKNLISNIGLSKDGTHYGSDIMQIPPKFRRLLYMKTYDYNFPLKHPMYIVNDEKNSRAIDACMHVGFREKCFGYKKRIFCFFKIK